MQLVGESVAAESGTQWDWDFLASPGNRANWVPKWGFKTHAPTFDPRFDIGGQFGGWHYGVKAYGGYGGEIGSDGEAKRGPDVNGYCDFAGVFGTGLYVTGVAGTSVNNVGVYGQTGEDPANSILQTFRAGVVGASTEAAGVLGFSTGVVGVWGHSFDGLGVAAHSSTDTGIYAYSGDRSGIVGVSFDPGPDVPPPSGTTPLSAGVVGTSGQRVGVIGTSDVSVGVYGFSNTHGVVGQTTNPAGFAGLFVGNVLVTGALTLQGDLVLADSTVAAKIKSAIVPFPDGSHRLLHCMESPEHWFEDFGAAKLKRGRAVVRLDSDFAKAIKRGDYKVFFTPEGDCRGLYLRHKGAASFEVSELMGGKSATAFSYRIVGRRKDVKGGRRFAKIDTRLSLPALVTRAPRKRATNSVSLRALAARLEKARQSRAISGRKGRRFGTLRKSRAQRAVR
jgi:hypothetical protein